MQRGERPVVPGVHGGEHVHRLRAAALAYHDAVRAHAQRIDHQLADGHLARPLGVARARLQAHHMGMLEKAQLGRILDGHDALACGNAARQRVEQRGLAAARTACHHHVLARKHRPFQKAPQMPVDRAETLHLLQRYHALGELADGDDGPVRRKRRDDHVHAMAFGHAGVHHRRRLVHTPAERPEHAIDKRPKLGLARKRPVTAHKAPLPLEEHVAGAVHHDLGDGRIGQQRLQWAEAEHLVDQLLGQPGSTQGISPLPHGQRERLAARP